MGLKKNTIALFLFIILISSTSTSVSAQFDLTALILYTETSERDMIKSFINTNMIITEEELSSLDSLDISSFDMIFIVSSDEISIDENELSKIESYIMDPDGITFIFTPKIDDFSDEIINTMGIESIGDTYGTNNSTFWEIEIDQVIGNYSIGDKFDYTGIITDLNLTNSVEILASVISSNSTEDEINYPIPILFNSSLYGVYTSPLSFISNNAEETEGHLYLNQIPPPDFIFEILGDMIESVISARQQEIISLSTTDSTSMTDSTQSNDLTSTEPTVSDDNIDGFNNLSDINPFTILIISVLSMIALFFRRIFENLRWILDKLLIFGVGVVGAYFNVQDRNLNHGAVLMNQYRSVILDLLDHVGELGSHLREIKTITKLGSGSLLWHLQVLEDFGLIQKFNVKRHTVFVSLEHSYEFDAHLKELELQLQSDHSKELLSKLSLYDMDDEISVNELLEDSEMSRKTAKRILKKIVKFGLIGFEEERPGYLLMKNKDLIKKLQSSSEIRDRFTSLEDRNVDISYN